MRFRIGCTDGKVYESDRKTDAELQEHLDSENGYVGFGSEADTRLTTVGDFCEKMLEFSKINSEYQTQTITLEISGRFRQFNVQHIVWAEYELDGE